MNSDIEKFIKGESKNSFSYFGAHKVSDGVCFRVYAPHAKEAEVSVLDKNYKMNRIDFRGVFEARVKEVREFDYYHYELLTNDNVWVNKNDPYTFYNENNKSVFLDDEEYDFNDEKWLTKDKEIEYFNGCLLKENFNMDEQRDFVEYLKKYNYNYLIIKPYDDKHLFSVNKMFINESSLKRFIDNLHQVNIGVIFDFDLDSFYDYQEGLNDFDGGSVYNKEEEKYNGVNRIYFDYNKNHTKSYILSFINYYLDKFHGDGLYTNDNEDIKEIIKEFDDKLVIYKGNENASNHASSNYLDKIIENVNGNFDHKDFLANEICNDTYIVCDYNECLNKIKGSESHRHEVARILLASCYICNAYSITVYNNDETYLKALKPLTDVYKNTRCLYNKAKSNLLLNGKKNRYFAYEYSSKNDYIVTLVNYGELEDEKFDLGMPYYGYYKLILDTKTNEGSEELYYTRNKKIHNKEIAIKTGIKPYQMLVFRRMRDI